MSYQDKIEAFFESIQTSNLHFVRVNWDLMDDDEKQEAKIELSKITDGSIEKFKEILVKFNERLHNDIFNIEKENIDFRETMVDLTKDILKETLEECRANKEFKDDFSKRLSEMPNSKSFLENIKKLDPILHKEILSNLSNIDKIKEPLDYIDVEKEFTKSNEYDLDIIKIEMLGNYYNELKERFSDRRIISDLLLQQAEFFDKYYREEF